VLDLGHQVCYQAPFFVVCIFSCSNNFTDIKYGYSKFDISSMFIDIKIENGKLYFSSKTIIATDDLINDIIAMMIKKQMFRLKKYLERD